MKKTVRTLQARHLFMPLGLLFFYIVVLVLAGKREHAPAEVIQVLLLAFLIVFTVCFIAQRLLHRFLVKKARKKTGLEEKLQAYQTAVTVRNGLLQGAGLFGGIVVLITQLYFLLIPGLGILLVFLISFPRKKFIAWELQLNEQEMAELKTYDHLIS